MMRRRNALVAITVVALGACGEADPATSPATSSPPSSVTPTSLAGRLPTTMDVEATTEPSVDAFARCEDVPRLSAPAEWYRDEPIYVANEMPIDAVRAWAEAQPGYAEIWIDRDHFGWITEVPTPAADLSALQEEVAARLVAAGVRFAGTGTDVTKWRLGITANAADERLAPALAGLPAAQMCIEDTGEPAPEGPQPPEGDGWRLLGDEVVGEPYRTGIATDDEQYLELWDRVGMTAARPAVDFASELVIWFGVVDSSGCAHRLDDLVVDMARTRPLVHAVTVVPGGTGACRTNAIGHAFVIALDRALLPPGPFSIQLGAEDPPLGAPEERTLVDANLSEPGATATADRIGPDPELIEGSGEQPPTASGGFIEPGYPWRYELYVHCGIGTLGQLNGLWWMTAEGAGDLDPVPEAWAPMQDDVEQTIVVDVLMTEGPAPTLTATANGYSVTYLPVGFETVPGCD